MPCVDTPPQPGELPRLHMFHRELVSMTACVVLTASSVVAGCAQDSDPEQTSADTENTGSAPTTGRGPSSASSDDRSATGASADTTSAGSDESGSVGTDDTDTE